MQRLRAEMLILGKQYGDLGTPEEQGESIDRFLSNLQELLTERMIETLLAQTVRPLYIYWVSCIISSGGDDQYAISKMAARIWTATHDRDVVVPVTQQNVTSIFNSLTRY